MSSNFDDQWITMAMNDDALVANLIILFRHHRSSRRPSPLRPWVHRQHRTPRLPVLDVPTRETAPTQTHHPSGSKAVDKSDSAADRRRCRSKKPLGDLQQEQELTLHEKKNLINELEDIYVTIEKRRGKGENLKKMKLDIIKSRRSLEKAEAVAEGKSSAAPEIGGQKAAPLVLLPDLNEPSEEYLMEFL